ncbi:mobile mystery protein A [Belliella sp. DSM 107340]|uniref:Mobile mystery protein A n=1 Tax=Belliella calami TaxID=2923436 RepID=A0ABS9UKX2_9BACT|nr:mobile mystery protein A [Belliella calami]MCH7397277.1 mobile mystery protein A [Belliella calami]
MKKKKLLLNQLESKLESFSKVSVATPPTGWIRGIRTSLGMTLQQLAIKLNVTKQSVQELEIREKEGTITIKTLREAGRALDLEFVYGFVPKDGSLEKYIEKKAYILAKKIVSRTSDTMKLEDQENSKQRIDKAIEERMLTLKEDLPKALWD